MLLLSIPEALNTSISLAFCGFCFGMELNRNREGSGNKQGLEQGNNTSSANAGFEAAVTVRGGFVQMKTRRQHVGSEACVSRLWATAPTARRWFHGFGASRFYVRAHQMIWIHAIAFALSTFDVGESLEGRNIWNRLAPLCPTFRCPLDQSTLWRAERYPVLFGLRYAGAHTFGLPGRRNQRER
jgi:hypothetical protein